jgi:hypothetical protein
MLIAYAPLLTAIIAFCSLVISSATWYSIRQRATRNEMLAMERRLMALESAREAAPNWDNISEIRREMRELHGHIELLTGKMQGIAHNTELILEQLLQNRREVMA